MRTTLGSLGRAKLRRGLSNDQQQHAEQAAAMQQAERSPRYSAANDRRSITVTFLPDADRHTNKRMRVTSRYCDYVDSGDDVTPGNRTGAGYTLTLESEYTKTSAGGYRPSIAARGPRCKRGQVRTPRRPRA